MNDLIKRLEEATEGSRLLDARIEVMVRKDLPAPMGDAQPYLKMPHKLDGCPDGTYWLVQRSGNTLLDAPHYTTNLQDALGLVSEGEEVWWEIRQMLSPKSPMKNFGSFKGLFHARVRNNYGEDGFLGKHDVPALSLCIAALKAREAE